MKLLKRFMVLVIVVGIGSILLQCQPNTEFRGHESEELTEHYNAIKAKDINSKEILLYIDGQLNKTDIVESIWMSDQLSLMIPDSMVNDVFHCNVAWLDDGIIRITKGTDVCVIDTDSNQLYSDGVWIDTDIVGMNNEGAVCLSIDFLAEFLGFSYEWRGETNTAYVTSLEDIQEDLPEAFDLRDQGRVTDVRDQGSWGTCWAFATLSAMESALLPEYQWEFSADHLVRYNGFHSSPDIGGDYNMALAYMASWKGPVTEGEDAYGDGYSPDNLSASVHLQDAVIINERDFDQIKSLIIHYGAVQSAIYSQPDIRRLNAYYNSEKASYYYPEDEECNHDIDIIGWDDHYPKENFSIQPEHDGAFICKNSWGSGFGQNGYFYISYDDPNIGIYGVAYTGIEAADNYQNIYQADQLGWTGSIGYGEPEAWFSNVYRAQSDETIEAVGFYTTDAYTSYDIYVVTEYDSIEDMDTRRIVQSGYIEDKGYHTVRLEQLQNITAGQKFAVIVRIYTEDAIYPVAIEFASNELTENVDLSDGEGYMSYNGSLWSHMEEDSKCNACLKVYTNSYGSAGENSEEN